MSTAAADTQPTSDADEELTFTVAPHIVEDLGLNLYTTLPRVLVEFIANAYDADAKDVNVVMDLERIRESRETIKSTFTTQKKAAEKTGRLSELDPLAYRTLPPELTIVVEDSGHGMSREDLKRKFLIAGRRRRKVEPEAKGRTPGGRPLMGRKGLGKLAGFGVGKKVEVLSRKSGEAHATKITMSYEALAAITENQKVPIPSETIADGGGLPATGGTRVVISELLYDPTEAEGELIENEIAEHFELIDSSEFSIKLNGKEVERRERAHDFAWPEPKLATTELVEHSWVAEDGRTLSFKYRLRFTNRHKALLGARRGVRVYAHGRLAAAPSLLSADTNMHGFRMTDYLDGVVHADFIDDEGADYIATNRQDLRWESPLLAPVHQFLSEQIKAACTAAQNFREEESPKEVTVDLFTKETIEQYAFTKRDQKVAFKIAAALNASCKQGTKDKVYKAKLPLLIKSIGHGDVMASISLLAEQDHPALEKVVFQVARLRRVEIDQLVTSARGRLSAITALKKIVEAVDFQKGNKENEVQKLLERAPWLIDPRFAHYTSANQGMETLMKRLRKELKIGEDAPKKMDTKERPDLVFLLGGEANGHIVIVELKAPNEPLDSEDHDQLLGYLREVKQYLKEKNKSHIRVTGQLIGSMPPVKTTARKALALRDRIDDAHNVPWRVRDFIEVLTDTEEAHREIIEAYADETEPEDE